MVSWFCIFVFKQNTAYELRISDWSSDVCSSDLIWIGSVICVLIQRHIVETKAVAQGQGRVFRERYAGADLESGCCLLISRVAIIIIQIIEAIEITPEDEIGRAHV